MLLTFQYFYAVSTVMPVLLLSVDIPFLSWMASGARAFSAGSIGRQRRMPRGSSKPRASSFFFLLYLFFFFFLTYFTPLKLADEKKFLAPLLFVKVCKSLQNNRNRKTGIERWRGLVFTSRWKAWERQRRRMRETEREKSDVVWNTI